MKVKLSVIHGDQVWFGHLGTVVFNGLIFFGATVPIGPGPPHYRRSTITLRHATLGRTPSDEWSDRRRDLHLTTHNAHKRQTSKPPAGFEPTIPASEWSQSLASDCATTGIGTIRGDANMDNSGGCKQIYVTLRLAWQLPALLVEEKDTISKPSSHHGQLTSPTGFRAAYLSLWRKAVWFWRLRVAVDENWHLLWNRKHIDRRLSLV
jgi:hypothetical protein